MQEDDDYLPDEEEPDSLRRKREREGGNEMLRECPHCGQPAGAESFFCLFCGERIFEDSGLLGRILLWLKRGTWVLIPFLILAVIALYGLF